MPFRASANAARMNVSSTVVIHRNTKRAEGNGNGSKLSNNGAQSVDKRSGSKGHRVSLLSESDVWQLDHKTHVYNILRLMGCHHSSAGIEVAVKTVDNFTLQKGQTQ